MGEGEGAGAGLLLLVGVGVVVLCVGDVDSRITRLPLRNDIPDSKLCNNKMVRKYNFCENFPLYSQFILSRPTTSAIQVATCT